MSFNRKKAAVPKSGCTVRRVHSCGWQVWQEKNYPAMPDSSVAGQTIRLLHFVRLQDGFSDRKNEKDVQLTGNGATPCQSFRFAFVGNARLN